MIVVSAVVRCCGSDGGFPTGCWPKFPISSGACFTLSASAPDRSYASMYVLSILPNKCHVQQTSIQRSQLLQDSYIVAVWQDYISGVTEKAKLLVVWDPNICVSLTQKGPLSGLQSTKIFILFTFCWNNTTSVLCVPNCFGWVFTVANRPGCEALVFFLFDALSWNSSFVCFF